MIEAYFFKNIFLYMRRFLGLSSLNCKTWIECLSKQHHSQLFIFFSFHHILYLWLPLISSFKTIFSILEVCICLIQLCCSVHYKASSKLDRFFESFTSNKNKSHSFLRGKAMNDLFLELSPFQNTTLISVHSCVFLILYFSFIRKDNWIPAIIER